ncbi:MAG: 30S ribosomal protein S21 [Acidimicrobiales bacterium]|nr:30S ribosomal protein S21 [Acidimicrobiales bacterium]
MDVKDNNVEQAIRILKKKLQKEGFFKIIKMKSNYEKPSEKRKRIKLENAKRIKRFQRLRNRF